MSDIRQIVTRLGGEIHHSGSSALVPGPGHSKADRSLSLLQVGDRVIWYSFAGDEQEAIRAHLGLTDALPATWAHGRRAEIERASQLRAARERSWRFCERVWGEAKPIAGTPAERYLSARGIRVTPTSLRYHPDAPCSYDGRTKRPALVALVRGPGGEPLALQSTFIRRDGAGKAFKGTSRLTFGPLGGGAVRLAEPLDGLLAVAEGIESALSFTQLFGIPCWAALGTSNLAAFEPPARLRKLYVAGDPGEGGVEAARRLANQVSVRMKVIISRPEDLIGDWNDVLRRKCR